MIKNVLLITVFFITNSFAHGQDSTANDDKDSTNASAAVADVIKSDARTDELAFDTLQKTTKIVELTNDCGYKKELFSVMGDCVKLKYFEGFYRDVYSKGTRCGSCFSCMPYFLSEVEKATGIKSSSQKDQHGEPYRGDNATSKFETDLKKWKAFLYCDE